MLFRLNIIYKPEDESLEHINKNMSSEYSNLFDVSGGIIRLMARKHFL